MTKKLLVRQGGGAASEVDFAAFTERKGAAFLEQQTPLIQMGQRFANGEAAQGYFLVVDPEGELPSDGFRLRPWAEVRLTDDASGDELTLAWMRLSAGDVSRKGLYVAGDEIQHSPQLMCSNIDLRGIPFVNQWHRDAETDQERLEALQARKLNGSASTDAVFRDTTDITIAGFSAGHLCDFAVDTDLDARNYQAGTEVLDVIAEIAEQAGKIFGVVLHHDGGSTHKCLLYIDQENLTSWTSDVRISDDPADWDPDDDTAPTFEPHWVQGSGKEGNFEPVVSGLVGIYGGSDDDSHTVFVDTGEAQEDQEVFVGVYNDDKSDSATQATRRANWQLTDRKRPFFSNRVSIIVRADQAHLVEAGQAIETKSVVFESGNLKGTFVTRRVAQKIIEPLPDGRYWLHLQLERPRMTRGANGGAAQPKATTPPLAEPGTDDIPAVDEETTLLKFFDANDAGGDTLDWVGILSNQGGSPGNGAEGSSWYYFKSTAPNEWSTSYGSISPGQHVRVTGYTANSSGERLKFGFSTQAAGTVNPAATIINTYTLAIGPTTQWTAFSVDITAPSGTVSWVLGRDGGGPAFDRVRVYTVDVEASPAVEGDPGDCPEDVALECSPGTGTRSARWDHVHAHGNLSDGGTHHHDTTQIEGFTASTYGIHLGDVPPASPGTYDEEFNGTADTLPSNWAWTSAPSGSDTWNLNSRWPSHLTVEGSGNTLYTLSNTSFSPASTFGLWCKVLVGPWISADNAGIRLHVSNSGSTERRSLNYRATGNHASGVRALRTISSVESVWSTELTGMAPGGSVMYMGMTRDGSNNYLAWWSRDGISWDALGATQAHSFTIDRIVITLQTTTTKGLMGIDWIRYRTDNDFPRP